MAKYPCAPGYRYHNRVCQPVRHLGYGNPVSGAVSGEMGTAFTEYYNPDGTIHGSSADGAYQGKWHIDGDTLCLEYDEPLGCRKIALEGDKVTYVTEEGEVDGSGTLITGNPNHY